MQELTCAGRHEHHVGEPEIDDELGVAVARPGIGEQRERNDHHHDGDGVDRLPRDPPRIRLIHHEVVEHGADGPQRGRDERNDPKPP